jgi:hypothetical protein
MYTFVMSSLRKASVISFAFVFATTLVFTAAVPARAQAPSNGPGFALQVTPSPLVATIKPGELSTQELRIRNSSTETQRYKMGLTTFTIDEESGQVNLGNGEPTEIKDFVRFNNPVFSVEPGQLFTQKVLINTPASAGFTYSFAITISRAEPLTPSDGTAAIEGSVAVFTLLNVDRPGVKREFELAEFSSAKRVYEYLPASFSLKLKNSGNTLVQPKGTIYIQRGSDDKEPIATIPLNSGGGYILPDTHRILKVDWDKGFPRYETVDSSDHSSSSSELKWHWNDLSQLRIGKYTAKVVAVYDDGQRDIPITSEVTFWVLPWKLIAGSGLVGLLILIGLITTIRRSVKVIRPKKVKPQAEN